MHISVSLLVKLLTFLMIPVLEVAKSSRLMIFTEVE